MNTRHRYLMFLLIPIILFLFFCDVSLAQTCPKNMYFDKDTNACACDQYTYWNGDECVYCPEGQSYDEDADECVPIVCPTNMYFDTNPKDPGYNTCQCVAGTTYNNGPGCDFPTT